MPPRSAHRRSPIVVKREPRPDRRRTPRMDILDPAALEAPLPGSLLVLLSRLHRVEAEPGSKSEPTL